MKSLVAIGLLILSDGCGPAEVGESCGEHGSLSQCVDGAICVTDTGLFGDSEVCMRRCERTEDCGDPGDRCDVVEGTEEHACQPCGMFGCWPSNLPH